MASLRIKKVGTSKLHGEEHFQFIKEFINEAEAAEVPALVPNRFEELLELHNLEDELLETVRKSPLTEKIEKADSERDSVFFGLKDVVKGMQSHYNPRTREAATNLMIVFNTYGNVSHKNYAEETGLLYNFIQEMRDNHAQELTTLKVDDWIEKLDEINQTFSDLIMERTRKAGEKPKIPMKEIKARIDACYGDIVRCLEAQTILASDHKLEPFFNTINSNVDRYKNTIAQREGRAAAAKKTEPPIVKPGFKEPMY
jgi:hypothetical protein